MSHFVIIPTYNEKGNIESVVTQVFENVPNAKVVVVDDNSPDGTAKIVVELQKKFSNLILKKREGKLGLATAYTDTIEYIMQKYPEADSITTMDADLSHDPKILRLMHKYINDFDLVIGSRYVAGGKLENWPLRRRLLSVLGNIYTRYVSTIPIHDLTAGFQCFRTTILRHNQFQEIQSNGFAFQMEMKMISMAIGGSVLEIPITFKDRTHGQSKISNSIIYEGLIVPWILRKRFKEILRTEADISHTDHLTKSS